MGMDLLKYRLCGWMGLDLLWLVWCCEHVILQENVAEIQEKAEQKSNGKKRTLEADNKVVKKRKTKKGPEPMEDCKNLHQEFGLLLLC